MLLERPETFRLNKFHPLAQGLVFAGLGAHAGSTRYHDSSVYGNTGTLTGGPTWAWDGTLGRWAMSFNGSNYVAFPPVVTIRPLTIAAFINPANVTSTMFPVALGAAGGSGADYFTIASSGATAGDPAQCIVDGTAAGTASAGQMFAGIWQSVIGVAAATNSRTAYLNGVPGTENTTETGNPSSVVYGTIGGLRRDTLTLPFTGSLSDVMIWNRVISLPEIQQLADPSNVMLSGLIQNPQRKWWPVVAAPPASTARNLILGGGVL